MRSFFPSSIGVMAALAVLDAPVCVVRRVDMDDLGPPVFAEPNPPRPSNGVARAAARLAAIRAENDARLGPVTDGDMTRQRRRAAARRVA